MIFENCDCCNNTLFSGRTWLGIGYVVCDVCAVKLGLSYISPVSDKIIRERINKIKQETVLGTKQA